jgi:hypothetical protein
MRGNDDAGSRALVSDRMLIGGFMAAEGEAALPAKPSFLLHQHLDAGVGFI